MWRFTFTLILMSWAFGLGSIAQVESNNTLPSISTEQTKFRKKAKEEITHWLKVHAPINVYGKIVDQNNVAVSNAEVNISWREPTMDLDLKVWSMKCITDNHGTFICAIAKGMKPIVRNISKDGYEFLFQQNPVVLLPMEDQGKALASTSRDKPIVLVLRKKGETTFLLHKDGLLIRASSLENKKISLDILKQKGEDLSAELRYQDIEVEVAYNPTNRKWNITYSATNGTDGILISNNILYEAPMDGYQKQVIFNGSSLPKYLYLRSRAPAIYSRLDFEYSTWKVSKINEGLRINYKALINPYGSRNLEYESGLSEYWKLRKQLEMDSMEKLRQDKRPEKPDLPKLIKDAKENYNKDKGKPLNKTPFT